MIVTLRTQRVYTLEQVPRVAAGEEPADFEVRERASTRDFIRRTLVQFDTGATSALLTHDCGKHTIAGPEDVRGPARGPSQSRCVVFTLKTVGSLGRVPVKGFFRPG